MIRVLMPISIDRWRASIATQMRAVVEANPEIEFHCFSNPSTDEDRIQGKAFWSLPNVVRKRQRTALIDRYDVIQLAALSGKNLSGATVAKARSFGMAHVTSILCVELTPEDPYGWKYYQVARYVADSFLGVSAVAGERARIDEPGKYMGVIHNGYDPDYFSPRTSAGPIPESIRDLPSGSYLLWVSSLEPRKRPEILIEIARRLPDVTFVAAGYILKGRGEGYLEEMLKLPNIRWVGLVDRAELRELFRHAAGLFFPSEREGLPLAVIEGMGMGLQILAQPKSSLPELVVPGVNGWLTDESEPDSWEAACRELMSQSKGERTLIGGRIHRFASDHLSWHAAGRKYGDYYRLVMTGREKEWRSMPHEVKPVA